MSRSPYTVSDLQRADRLWDKMSLSEVEARTGIPEGTLKRWSRNGLISTDADHRGPDTRVAEETIERINVLWKYMPLTAISDLLDIPYTTLNGLRSSGHIHTETEHRGQYQVKGMKKKTRRAAHLAEKCDTNRAAAQKMGVAESTFYRYLKLYRQGKYESP